jgi:hypothetical protein
MCLHCELQVCGAITRVLQRESVRIDNIQQAADEIHQRNRHAAVASAKSDSSSTGHRPNLLHTGTSYYHSIYHSVYTYCAAALLFRLINATL